MMISQDKAVAFDFTLSDQDGSVLDTSHGKEPFTYLHGFGGVVPGLEKALEGRSPGDELDINVPPEEAYGVRDEANRMDYARDEFADDELVVGNKLYIMTMGGPQMAVVVGFDDQTVVIDTNHELAGKTLRYQVRVLGVRNSTIGERMCGHIHDPVDSEV